jgi:hypothetical protein
MQRGPGQFCCLYGLTEQTAFASSHPLLLAAFASFAPRSPASCAHVRTRRASPPGHCAFQLTSSCPLPHTQRPAGCPGDCHHASLFIRRLTSLLATSRAPRCSHRCTEPLTTMGRKGYACPPPKTTVPPPLHCKRAAFTAPVTVAAVLPLPTFTWHVFSRAAGLTCKARIRRIAMACIAAAYYCFPLAC